MPIQSLTIPLIPEGPRFPITLPSKLSLRNLEGGGRPRGSDGSLMRGREGHLKPIIDHIVDSGTSRVWKSRSPRKKKKTTLNFVLHRTLRGADTLETPFYSSPSKSPIRLEGKMPSH